LFLIKTLLEDSGVELTGAGITKVYGAYAESYSDEYKSVPTEIVKGLSDKYFGDRPSWFWVGIKRTRVVDYKGEGVEPYRTEVLYLFSSKEDRDSVCSRLGTLKPLNAVALANKLFHFHAVVSPYHFTDDGLVLKGVPKINEDTIYSVLLRDKYSDLVYNEMEKARCRKDFPYRVYKSESPLTEEPDLERVFKNPWEGVIWIKIGVGNFYNTLKLRAQSLSVERASFWKEIAEKHRVGELPLCFVEITAITPDRFPLPQLVGQGLSFNFVEWFVRWDSNLFNPIFTYEDSFSHFLTVERTAKLMPLSFGKTSFRKGDEPVTIYGISPYLGSVGSQVSGELFYFHLAEEGKFHSVIVAPQRSGKSFTNQIIITTLAKIDVKALYNGTIRPFELPVKIVQFDVGFSAEFLVELLKARGFNVRIFPPKRTVKINPLEIDSVDEVLLAVNLINVLWETKSQNPLSPEELALLEKGIKVLMKNPKLWSVNEKGKTLESIKETHPHLFKYALSKGFKPKSLLAEAIKKLKPFEVFKYPILVDLVRILKILAEKSLNEGEKKAFRELATKLGYLTEMENFSSWSSMSFSPVDYFYIDLHYIKDVKEIFVPFYLAMLKKTLKMLGKLPFDVPKYLTVDEFHNFVNYKTFEKFFEVLVREAAKRNIYLSFISQNADDIPKGVVLNVRTRIILKGQEGSRDSDFLDSVKKYLNVPQEAIERYKELPRYCALVNYGEGEFFGAQFPVTKESLKVFESRKLPVLKTPDGIVIKKSFLPEE